MKPVHRKDDRWQVRIPAKLSKSGKRESRYFPSKSKALEFISGFKEEKREHGKQSVSSEERHWINVVRTELGSLDRLREVLDHWSRTGKGVSTVSVSEATELFIRDQEHENLNPKTMDDIRWRIRTFGQAFGATLIHQITPGQIEEYLKTLKTKKGQPASVWNKKSFYKRLQPFFEFAKRRRWLISDPFDELEAPETEREPLKVYQPEELRKLLLTAIELEDWDAFRFVALAGLAFFRTRELVRAIENEPVLEWSDVLWDRGEIHVREEVGKHTKRSSNERFVPLHAALDHCLTVHTPKEKRIGRIVDCSRTAFRRRIKRVFAKAEVKFLENGLRKSAISYWLAANPEHGVGEVARYAGNSEPSCRQHCLRILTKEQGEAWFKSAVVFRAMF